MIKHQEVNRLVRIGELLARNRWAKANAGNMSVRLDPKDLSPLNKNGEIFPIKYRFPKLAGNLFLITGTGRRMRDLPRDPESCLGLVEILDGGDRYRSIWGCGRVTSEFPAHLAIHDMCIAERPEMKAVLHTHPPHLIAMTHLPDMKNPDAVNSALRRVHPETFILLPQGTVNFGYRIPGSMELGMATRDALGTRDTVLWSMHGIVSIAVDMDKAYDNVEILEKAAQIYMMVLWAGQKFQGLSDAQIAETMAAFNIKTK